MNKFIVLTEIVFLFFLAGCSSKVEVVLLPQADGSVGKVMVSDGGKETVLDKAWQKVETKNLDKKEILSKEIVESKYELLLEAMPKEMKKYRLYFKFDSNDLAEQSSAVFKQMLKDIKSEDILEIDVIGYTDRAGNEAYNKTLSMKRAKKVIELLKSEGIPNDIISIDYYGEANPIIPTADGIAKKVNRRVEVIIK